jgi:hypothetical protein
MAIICRDYNLLFIMTPRTGCTAIGRLLCDHYRGEFLPAEDILDSKGMICVQKKHSTLSELLEHKLLTAEEGKSLLKVAAVRNPFDSLVSFYFKQRLKYQALLADSASWVNRSPRYAQNMNYAQWHSFNQWVFKVCYRKLVKSLLGGESSMFPGHTRGMNVVLRYEHLEEDLKEAFRKASIPWKADIPIVNRTEERDSRDYQRYYSLFARLTVGRAFADDLKAYGYRF